MANITAADVNKLRQETGIGMMDCKKALVEAEGDFEKARDILRKKGQKVAAKRADRASNEGRIIAKTNADRTKGYMLIMACETDFVGKGEEFVNFTDSVLDKAMAADIKTKEDLLNMDVNGMKVSEKLIELAQGDIPEQMYDNQANDMVRDFEMRLRSQGMDPKMYMQYMDMDMAALKNMYMDEAEKRVKLRLVLEAIAKQENLEVTEADLEDEYSKMAEAYKVEVEQAKASVPADSLSEDIRVQKALELVKNSAVIK